MKRAALAALCFLFPLALAAREGGRDNAKSALHAFNLYSLERELALGKQLAGELERQIKLADDPILSEYVNRLAQNIARQSEVAIPVSIRIIESGDLNAFTLPGGHMYINSGMLRLTESEAELAFVVAHELGHVAARHATREASRDQLTKLGSFPLSVVGGWTGAALRQASGPGSKLGLLKGARDFELQADRLGVEYLESAGYDPEAAIDVFERIEVSERKTPRKIARLGGDHPITSDRIEQAQKHLNATVGQRAEYIVNTSEYEQMRLRAVALEDKRISEAQGPVLVKSAAAQ